MTDESKTREQLIGELKELRRRVAELESSESVDQRTGEALREEKAFTEGALDALMDVFFVFDLENRLLRWNKALNNVSGYSDEELSLMKPVDLVAKEDAQRVAEAFRLAASDGRFNLEVSLVTRHGRDIPYAITGVLLRDLGGRPLGVCGIGRNIIARRRAADEIKRRNEELAALNAIAGAVSQSLDLGGTLSAALEEALTAFKAEGGVIYLAEERGETFIPVVHRGLPQEMLHEIIAFKPGEGLSGHIAQSGEPLVVADLAAEPRILSPTAIQKGWLSYAAAPIESKGKVLGIITLIARQKGHFRSDHKGLLIHVGHQIGVAIENARLYEQVQARSRYLETLQQINATLRSTLPLSQVLNRISQGAGQALNYVATLIATPDAAGERLILSATWNDELLETVIRPRWAQWSEKQWETFSLPLTTVENPVVQSYLSADLQAWRDIEQIIRGIEPPISPRLTQELMGAVGAKSVISLPLRVGENVMGLLIAFSPRERLSDEERDLLTGLANQAGLAIANAQLFEEVSVGRERLRQLTQQLVSAQEEERRRLSRELHDEVGQALTALKISLQLIESDLPTEATLLLRRLDEAIILTDATMEQMRTLAHDLRPPALDTVGLNPTLEGFCHEFSRLTKLRIEYEGTDLPLLSDAVSICLYRFLQEALTNTIKHAQASWVRVALHFDGRIVSLSVSDDGRGFDAAGVVSVSNQSTGIGLLGMHDRLELLGGRLEITSQPGQGTHLVAHVPWKESP